MQRENEDTERENKYGNIREGVFLCEWGKNEGVVRFWEFSAKTVCCSWKDKAEEKYLNPFETNLQSLFMTPATAGRSDHSNLSDLHSKTVQCAYCTCKGMTFRKLALVGIIPIKFSSLSSTRIRKTLGSIPGGAALCFFVWSGCQFFYLCRCWKRREFDRHDVYFLCFSSNFFWKSMRERGKNKQTTKK